MELWINSTKMSRLEKIYLVSYSDEIIRQSVKWFRTMRLLMLMWILEHQVIESVYCCDRKVGDERFVHS